MSAHHGGHPRMGAADVIPFMPVRGVTMDECVALARDFGRALAETLDIPVYLYDRAALSPERASLAEVRKGEFEGLRDAVARGERLPDFGPHAIGRAGATAVGARKPLVAFNVYLDGTDETAAKEIARGVRESSGGLPALRAIAFAVPERGGIVTVSMNLVDHEVTGPARGVRRRGGARRRPRPADHGVRDRGSGAGSRRSRPATWSTFVSRGFEPDGQILERLVAATDRGVTRDGRSAGGPDAWRGSWRSWRRMRRPRAAGAAGAIVRSDGRGADRDGRPAHGGQAGVRGPGRSDARVGGASR